MLSTPNHEDDILLKVENLVVSFHSSRGKVDAVRDISFSVHKGENVAIVGESGSGKSSVALAITRLIPTSMGTIEQGKILFEQQDLLLKSQKELEQIRGNHIGMIFQDPLTSLNPTMRIGKQIMEGAIKHHKLKRKEARDQALTLLHDVGISNPDKRLDQFPHELSGGMRQRVALAMALACQPKLLIADEPTTALDVTVQAQIIALLEEIQKKRNLSIILITHDLGIVARFAQHVLVMHEGKIVESAPVEALYYSPQHPYTKRLLSSVPRIS